MKRLSRRVQKRIAGFWLTAALGIAVFLGNDTAATAYALTPEEEAWVEEAGEALQDMVADREIMAVVYLCDRYPVKEEASGDSGVVTEVPGGQTVFIKDVTINDEYEAWEYVSFYLGTREYHGYIPREYLACSDERFLAWEETYGMNPAAYAPYTVNENGTAVNPYADVEMFPATYQPALKALKDKHPNWIFVPMNTGLDWDTVIANEIVGAKSLVYKSFPEYAKEGVYDEGSWFYASEEILELYMDPRNALTEDAIFQFEQLTYNASYHSEEALAQFLQSTFMKSDANAPGTDKTYARIIWEVGQEKNISPFHLASRIYQEQGQGTSPLISGTYAGYEGLYNYFNVGATGQSDTEEIVSGLEFAKKANPQWNNAEASIRGGADVISGNYIQRGQDTLYLQKYNVNPSGYYKLYSHQYMQNISAPTTEAKSIRNSYRDSGKLENAFVFKIPVFNNMPQACPMPTFSTNVVLQIPEGYDTTVYLDGVERSAATRNGRQIVTAGNGEAQTAVVYRYNESGVPTGMYVWTLEYKDGAYLETPQPELADLLTYHGFSIRITGKAGIRFKTGISAELRQRLLTDGVNGYRLKEYGTLIMNNANRATYPMIKGGEKVLGGMAYGMDANGVLTDRVYEKVNDRYRYTSVLVGLPATQYKVEYAFRGYIVLEKDGIQKIFYGSTVARSIYSLAEQVLNAGTYPRGTEADVFLRQLIADADALELKSAGSQTEGTAGE